MTPLVDVSCVGAGLSPRDHITLEGLRALRASQRVFYASELQELRAMLDEEHIAAEDVSDFFRFGAGRVNAYDALAEYVLDASRSGPVSWVTLGSPSVVCGVTVAIEATASRRGLRTRRCLAVSSTDLIASELGLDLATSGLTVLPASALVSGGVRPSVATGCIVMMVARAETALHVLDARLKPGALARVARALAEVYPASHPAVLYTAALGRGAPRRFDTTIAELEGAYEHVDPWSSLYVPPVPWVISSEERQRLLDFSHAALHYETPLERVLRESVAKGSA